MLLSRIVQKIHKKMEDPSTAPELQRLTSSQVSEIGSSEGACSRPMTPRTYTPKISSPPSAVMEELERRTKGADGAGVLPWRPGNHSPTASTVTPNKEETMSRGIMLHHAADDVEDVLLRLPRTQGSSSSVENVQKDRSGTPDSIKIDINERGATTRLSPGRGRGLAGLMKTSDVGRTRSPSPLSPPSSTTSSQSNILKSGNLQRMLEKSSENPSPRSPCSSPQSPSYSPSDKPSTSSPKSTPQPSPSPPRPLGDNCAVPSPRIRKPLVVEDASRQPFLRDVSVRPKEPLTSPQGLVPSLSGRLSPPSFLSPVSNRAATKLPWKGNVQRGPSKPSPPSSDWNKMSSTSGQSDASEGEVVTTPVRTKMLPTSLPPSLERAKLIEESLKKQLKAGSPEDEPHTRSSHDRHHSNDMGVIMHGDRPPEPIRQITNAPFPEVIKKVYQREETHLNMSLLQAYAWPAVLRGRDLVGVAPRDRTNNLAYLLPVITQVLQSSSYTNLPPGNGPLVLILCTSWEHAQVVCDACVKYVRAASKSLNTIFLYGGNNEKQQEVQLVNGCQILISTLPCVLKMKERNLTNFNRLCHVIFDEANILLRDFFDEVKSMMRELLGVLRVDQRRSAPRQLLVFAYEWTSAIGSFLRTYMTNQLVVITHKLEAAVYARVRQNIEMVDSSQRTRVLLSKLQSGMLKGTKAIIFANDRKTAIELMKTLTTSSIYTLLATDGMPSDSIERIKKEWYTHHRSDSIPILVMTDGAINDVGVSDAMYVIHYDFPLNKGHYGKRMGCMMRHYESQLKEKKSSSCQSLSFVSPDSIHVLSHMSELLFRSGQPLPPQFTHEQVNQAKEDRRKGKPLCNQLKSFGVCRSREHCGSRHQVFADLDEPGIHPDYIDLPRQGTVKLIITHMMKASNYYVRLLDHRLSPDHKVVSMATDYYQLTVDLQEWYTDPINNVGQRPLGKDDVCGFKDHAGCYSRVRVEALVAKETADSPGVACVFYVDRGGCERVSIDKLLKLPDHLRQVKFQAVEVFLSRVKPTDKDYSWNPRADNFMYDFLGNKELHGKIVLSLGNTLWLDPLVERCMLAESKTFVDIHTRREMMKQGHAVDNPDHIKNLQDLCEGKLKLPKDTPLTQVSKSVKLPAPARLSEDVPNPVYMTAIENPSHIYVQLVKSNYRLETLMQNLNHKMADFQVTGNCEVNVGELCIARCDTDERWYRARVMGVKDDEVDVFYIDYGDMEFVQKGYVFPIPQEFTNLAPQAIQCSLEAIQPVNQETWDEEATEEMWNMCVGESSKHAVSVEVQSSGLCDKTGGYSYVVNMYNEMGGEKILVSKRLIDAGLAKPTEDFMKIMFSIETSSSDDDVIQQLNKLCAQLYQVKSLQGQLGLVAKIDELMAGQCDKTPLLNSGSIKSLCQVLCNGKLRENTKEQLVLSLLRVSCDSPRISLEIAGEGGLKSIHNALLQTSDPCLKEDITFFIQEISTEKRTRDLFLNAGGIAILHHLLDSDNSSSVIKNVCDTLRNIVFYNDIVRDSIPTEVIASLCNTIKRTDDLKRAEHINKFPHVLAVLSDLAKSQRNRYVMYENEGVEAACNIMWNVRDNKVVHQTAVLLKRLGEDHVAKQMMLDQDLTPCLSGCLMSQDLSAQSKDECLPLLDMIDQYEIDQASSLAQSQRDPPQIELTVPKTHPKAQSKDSRQAVPLNDGGDASHLLEDDFDDMPLLEEDELEIKQCHPKILWSQNATSVLLSVQLRDVKDPDVFITTSSISFSAILDSVEYVFELDLFSRVDSTNCTMVSAGREFLITLYKEGISIKWTRLTQTKEKIPYISVDFERWRDEDDDQNSKRKPYSSKKVPVTLADPGLEMSINYHSASEDDDHSDVSGDEFDKAFEAIPTPSSRSDTDVGFSS